MNRYDRTEWAGACGDLGTLIPFVAGYIGVVKMAPAGILCSFGLAMLVCGFYYKTPIPVQPMKAIAAVALTQAGQLTPATIYAAALVTGLLWLGLGLSGEIGRIAALVPRPVVSGIVLGLGAGLLGQGLQLMATQWLIALVGLVGTLLLLIRPAIPAMFLLLLFGVGCGLVQHPLLPEQLVANSLSLSLPTFPLFDLSGRDLLLGTLLLALPQLPLTLGNAVIAVRAENNRLFPERQISERQLATTTGIMNLGAAFLGGVPQCHGAGGLAGHVTFGARSGGALVILGSLLLLLGLFFSPSIHLLFQLFPEAILGVILFFGALQLLRGGMQLAADTRERWLALATALLTFWNLPAAFVIGMLLFYLLLRRSPESDKN